MRTERAGSEQTKRLDAQTVRTKMPNNWDGNAHKMRRQWVRIAQEVCKQCVNVCAIGEH